MKVVTGMFISMVLLSLLGAGVALVDADGARAGEGHLVCDPSYPGCEGRVALLCDPTNPSCEDQNQGP